MVEEGQGSSRDLSQAASGVREPADLLTLHERLALFASTMLDAWSEGSSMDGGDIQDAAESLGLLVKTEFNSEVHTDAHGVGAEDGDEWFVLPGDLSREIRHATLARKAFEAATASPADGETSK